MKGKKKKKKKKNIGGRGMHEETNSRLNFQLENWVFHFVTT